MTLSMPVKVVALGALALALGMAGVLMLVGPKGGGPEVIPTVHHAKASVKITPSTPNARPKVKPKPKVELVATLPPGLRRGLLKSAEVVAVVYASNVAGDRAAAVTAREAAHDAHVGFVALNVLSNTTAAAVAGWTTSTATPAVYIVRRPGSAAVYTLSGPADRETIAQAALAAK